MSCDAVYKDLLQGVTEPWFGRFAVAESALARVSYPDQQTTYQVGQGSWWFQGEAGLCLRIPHGGVHISHRILHWSVTKWIS